MPKLEKVLHGDINKINDTLSNFMIFNCGLTNKRESWTTTFGDCKCIVSMFEKHAKRIWDDEAKEWKNQPHYGLSLTLIDTGEEIRLCGITCGSGQEMYFIPDCGAEGELIDVLNTGLILLDQLMA